jgi:hypothetical protein
MDRYTNNIYTLPVTRLVVVELGVVVRTVNTNAP